MISQQPRQIPVFAAKPVRPLRYISTFNHAKDTAERIEYGNSCVVRLDNEIMRLEPRKTIYSMNKIVRLQEERAQALDAIKKDELKLSALNQILKDGAGAFADFADKVGIKPVAVIFLSAIGMVVSAIPWFNNAPVSEVVDNINLQTGIIFGISAAVLAASTWLMVQISSLYPDPPEAKPK